MATLYDNPVFKTKPFAHQYEAWKRSKDAPVYALLMEQGTGKTKVAVDTAAHLFLEGKIDALLVVAPNGVHRNWIADEIPVHLTDLVARSAMIYSSGKANNKGFKREFGELLEFKGLSVLAMNVDALITKNGKEYLKHFFKQRRVMFVIDESTDIKTPSAKRTKTARGFAKHAPYKRILTGTPTGNGNPLDLYSQFAFLDVDILGHSSYTAYKHEYATWEARMLPGQKRAFQVCTGFKNLDRLKKLIDPYSYRVTKAEALDLPPKLYTKRYFGLSKQQLKHYRDLRTEFFTELKDGTLVAAPMVLQRMLRLQQVACGYLGTGIEGSEVTHIEGPNTRLDALKDVLEHYPGPTIIWARFREDIRLITELLGDRAVRYDGSTTEEERAEAKQRFMAGEVDYFVGNPKAGGRGLTLHRAKNVIYYSSYFGLETRQQSEDRAHRIGLQHPVTYVDIVAEDTVDEKILKALREGHDIANLITGDTAREWI